MEPLDMVTTRRGRNQFSTADRAAGNQQYSRFYFPNPEKAKSGMLAEDSYSTGELPALRRWGAARVQSEKKRLYISYQAVMPRTRRERAALNGPTYIYHNTPMLHTCTLFHQKFNTVVSAFFVRKSRVKRARRVIASNGNVRGGAFDGTGPATEHAELEYIRRGAPARSAVLRAPRHLPVVVGLGGGGLTRGASSTPA